MTRYNLLFWACFLLISFGKETRINAAEDHNPNTENYEEVGDGTGFNHTSGNVPFDDLPDSQPKEYLIDGNFVMPAESESGARISVIHFWNASCGEGVIQENTGNLVDTAGLNRIPGGAFRETFHGGSSGGNRAGSPPPPAQVRISYINFSGNRIVHHGQTIRFMKKILDQQYPVLAPGSADPDSGVTLISSTGKITGKNTTIIPAQ